MTPCRQPTETDPATGQTAFAQDFGHNRRLRELRVAHGITQQQIGDALGVHSSRISEIERGTRNLPELERRAALWIQTITTPNQPTQHTETFDNV